jgi:dTDP-4-amino-4,6-dideoxygalactose transaminase
MTNSGASSLLAALAALKEKYCWKDGDDVIVPAVSFIATSNIVMQLNMKPVFVDVEREYYGIEPKKVLDAITPRTRCIIPVHLFGMPCQMDAIMAIAEEYKLPVIEDSCQTMFARFNGQAVGSFGEIGCFSTYVAHHLPTGVGGLCTTNDPELAIVIRSLINHGRDSIYLSIDDDQNKTGEERQLIISKRFSFVRMGYSFRTTELEGALGLAEFENHEEMINRRQENGAFLTEELSKLDNYLQLPALRPGAEHSYMMYPIVLRSEPKKELVYYLEENGIETRDMLPITNQPYYQRTFNLNEDDFPVAKWINQHGFYVASHQDLTTEERQHIVSTIFNFFRKKHGGRIT